MNTLNEFFSMVPVPVLVAVACVIGLVAFAHFINWIMGRIERNRADREAINRRVREIRMRRGQ